MQYDLFFYLFLMNNTERNIVVCVIFVFVVSTRVISFRVFVNLEENVDWSFAAQSSGINIYFDLKGKLTTHSVILRLSVLST